MPERNATHERDQTSFTFQDQTVPPDPPPQRRIYTVTELVGTVRTHIEREYSSIWVDGEISNLRSAPSGHLYFTLKDGDAQLPVVLFRRQALLLRFRADDGLRVLVRGKISVYEQRGQMQLIAETLEPVGAGSLQIALEQLKDRLRAEGLFSSERKRPLPAFPRSVGIITSPGGAVIRDFLNVVGRRHAALDVVLFPALVQGENSVSEVAAGIDHFNRDHSVDVIVLARGGGSLEDLAPFNAESLARAIAASEIPIVSAIGHETDFTIADFASDLRAPTPSAAAELITAAQHRVEERVSDLRHRLLRACRYQLMMATERFSRVSIAAAAARLRDALGRRQQRVDELQFRLEGALQREQSRRSLRLSSNTAKLLRHDPSHTLRTRQERVLSFSMHLTRSMQNQIALKRSTLENLDGRLQTLSPLAVLGRGYAIVFNQNGQLLRRADETSTGETLTTRLHQGLVTSTVTFTKQ